MNSIPAKSKIEIIKENTIPVVGKYYWVRCAKIITNSGDTAYTPVIGEIHRDPEFGTPQLHLHIDGRFQNTNATCHNVDENGKSNYIVEVEDTKYVDVLII